MQGLWWAKFKARAQTTNYMYISDDRPDEPELHWKMHQMLCMGPRKKNASYTNTNQAYFYAYWS
jgi:hypothetical protein